jgi:hypothetical protein
MIGNFETLTRFHAADWLRLCNKQAKRKQSDHACTAQDRPAIEISGE